MVLNLFDNPEIVLIILKVSRRSSIILDDETISHVFFQCFEPPSMHLIHHLCANFYSFKTFWSGVWYGYVTIKWWWRNKNSTYYFDLNIKLQFYVLFSSRKWFRHTFLSQIQLTQTFLLQKWFEHTCFVAKTIYTHFFCRKNYLRTFFVTKRIYAPFLSQKQFTRFFCRENNLCTSSGKFLRVESCHPESLDFLGLCIMASFKGRIGTSRAPQNYSIGHFT